MVPRYRAGTRSIRPVNAKAHSEERRLITSLFIDVVGSTELTVRLGPERLKGALDQAFAELRAVIEREGGTVEKYIGDAIYAIFGAPVAHHDDPERALRAAAGARDWAVARASAPIPFGVRVGLETGEAIVDLAAAADTKQQMSVGAVVNTAARLQQRAEPGQVLVGPVTHSETAEIATFAPLGALELKGLGSIEVWLLDAVHTATARQHLPFVGRDAEMELLGLARRRSKTRSVLALVSGPPGQGKTRLVDEFLATQRDLRVLTARCRPGGEVGALAPLRELLVGDAGEEALDALVASAIPEQAERGRVREALAHSAGLRANAALAALGKDERADEIVNAWQRLLRGLAAADPLALWIEDVHWAAPEVVSLIDRLSLTGEPMLVVATARPEFAEESGLRPTGDRFFIELEGLEGTAARALAWSAGGGDERTLERAEGNPLFIVEIARGRETASLPLTLQGALGARLDELTPDERQLLARAAVVGETFSVDDCAVLCGREPADAGRALSHLAALQYLDPVDGRYRFHHSLLRDVAYGRLLVADRMRLHARIARERSADDPEVQAHHWWAALGDQDAAWVWQGDDALPGMRRDAFAAHLATGRRQADLFAIDRAATAFARAYTLAEDEMQRAAAKQALGDAYAQALRGDEAWAAYADARGHYAAAGGVPAEAYVSALKVRMRIGAFNRLPDASEMRSFGREAEAAARARGDPAVLARTLVYTAFEDMNPATGKGDPARIAEAVRLSETAEPAVRREILGWYAQDLIRGLQVDRATVVLDQIEAANAPTNELDRMEHERGRALLALRRGDLTELRRRVETLVAMSRRMGPHLRTHADLYASDLAFTVADWAAVARLGTETDRLMESSPGTAFCAAAGSILGLAAVAHARDGRSDDARALIGRMRTITSEQLYLKMLIALAAALAGDRPDLDLVLDQKAFPDLALLAVVTRRHDDALRIADQLEVAAQGGARFWAAVAAAVREEVARDRTGAATPHALLRGIGYIGWSEVLSRRAPA